MPRILTACMRLKKFLTKRLNGRVNHTHMTCLMICVIGGCFLFYPALSDVTRDFDESRAQCLEFYSITKSIQRWLNGWNNSQLIAWQHEQQRRIRHLRSACSDPRTFSNLTYIMPKSPLYYYSPKYKFNYCKVPKAGCSIWTQVFTILRYGSRISTEVFRLPRNEVHSKLTLVNRVLFNSEERQRSCTVLVARDPYSRLYSAFVDKVFLPSRFYITGWKRNVSITPSILLSAINITFETFLAEIVNSAYRGETLNRHIAPIFSICTPCQTKILALVKQETFVPDMENVLKLIGIASAEYQAIHDALYEDKLKVTVPSLIKTVLLLRAAGLGKNRTKTETAMQIWQSLQIQGYIRDEIAFPSHIVDTEEKAGNPSFLSYIAMKAINRRPMSAEESKQQRRRALVKAYKNIGQETIDGLKRIYRQDFIMFNYSFNPPLD